MAIQLKSEQEKFIEQQFASGKSNSSEEVVDKMFQVFENLQSEYDEWGIETRNKVDIAIAEIARIVKELYNPDSQRTLQSS